MCTDQDSILDAGAARAACREVLARPVAESGAELDARCEELTGHLRTLLAELLALAPRMRDTNRDIAVRLMAVAHRTLDDCPEAGDDRRIGYVYDAECLIRSMLMVWESPGPLGDPVDADGIEQAIRARICVACMEPIRDGEGCEEIVLPTLSAGCMTAHRHTDSCSVVAARRRVAFQVVPTDSPAPPLASWRQG